VKRDHRLWNPDGPAAASGPADLTIKWARNKDVGELARIWFDGWRDAHAHILPTAIARHRTRDSFRERLHGGIETVRVAERRGVIAGFAMTKGNEVYQLYVAAPARGLGVANALLDDAVARIRSRGAATVWLGCAIGNERAASFYEKSGWRRVGIMRYLLEIPGDFHLDVWRYELDIGSSGSESVPGR
jgi:ribosomal protein S18 acetylase RimI-like enzyme